jgi:methyl-accepting chemotaxis protein
MSEKLLSIRGKIALLTSGVLVFLAVLDAWLIPEHYADVGMTSLAERAEAEAALLAQTVEPALEFSQRDTAGEMLEAALADELVAWAAIYDPEGRKIVSVGNHQSPARIAPRAGEVETTSGWTRSAAAEVIGAAGRLGFVAVALRTSSVVEGVALTRERMLRQAALVTAVGVALAFWLSGTIVDPLRRVTLGARRIAEGDIGFDIATSTSRDEVGALSQAFATMRKRLRDLVTKIGSTSQALSTAATGMFSEVREQEALATQQTAALEEIQRTLETLSTAAEQVERDAQTVRTMAERNLSTSQQIAERTRMLSTHSDRIGEILSLIQDIADRSDLLALNAALEGTKAGEVGRGFSLVAAEMRRLSEHVKDSVRDIRKLVADMREASHASVLATEEGIRVSEETSTAAVKISDAIVRQREGTAQVKASADEIVNVVNESLEGRAETTSSAEALLTLSQELREAVSSFRVGAASSPSDEPRS